MADQITMRIVKNCDNDIQSQENFDYLWIEYINSLIGITLKEYTNGAQGKS